MERKAQALHEMKVNCGLLVLLRDAAAQLKRPLTVVSLDSLGSRAFKQA